MLIRLTDTGRALKQKAAAIPACILGTTGCSVDEVMQLVDSIKVLRHRLMDMR